MTFAVAIRQIASGLIVTRSCKTCRAVKAEAYFRPRHRTCKLCENRAAQRRYYAMKRTA